MKYYPIFLDIKDKPCLVIGGGPVGARKAAMLEKCGAGVRVVSERFDDSFGPLKKKGVCLGKKSYEKKDMEGMVLVFAATDKARLNQQIKSDAEAANIFCNVADGPDESDFILPSIVDKGDLILAVSTCGSSPAMAKQIRQELDDQFGLEYADLLKLMGAVRKKLLATGHAPDAHKKSFFALIENNILEWIEAGDINKINTILKDVLGDGYRYEELVL
ncbi:MAG: bifunctional precorrin-2 dehydrogenase/sirohydrochlorin ferrochelatase [Desulfobacula sp.]|nr:bifunctional precorrin-2 dehydrogenase/sirohydrochlorin ferrochelatase [Desulfobacula sp.]